MALNTPAPGVSSTGRPPSRERKTCSDVFFKNKTNADAKRVNKKTLSDVRVDVVFTRTRRWKFYSISNTMQHPGLLRKDTKSERQMEGFLFLFLKKTSAFNIYVKQEITSAKEKKTCINSFTFYVLDTLKDLLLYCDLPSVAPGV